MPYNDPGTRSPGKIVLFYMCNAIPHRVGANLVLGKMPASGADAATIGTAFANAMKPVLGGNQSFTSWALEDEQGGELYAGNFPAPIAGTANYNSGNSNSATKCLTGRGTSDVAGTKRGTTRVFIFDGRLSAPGVVEQPINAVDAWATVAASLDASDTFWADHYGQKAASKSHITFQANAQVQKHFGV